MVSAISWSSARRPSAWRSLAGSVTTPRHDRTRELAICRRLESLREYALVDPETRRMEVCRLGDDGLSNLPDMSDGAGLGLATVGARLTT